MVNIKEALAEGKTILLVSNQAYKVQDLYAPLWSKLNAISTEEVNHEELFTEISFTPYAGDFYIDFPELGLTLIVKEEVENKIEVYEYIAIRLEAWNFKTPGKDYVMPIKEFTNIVFESLLGSKLSGYTIAGCKKVLEVATNQDIFSSREHKIAYSYSLLWHTMMHMLLEAEKHNLDSKFQFALNLDFSENEKEDLVLLTRTDEVLDQLVENVWSDFGCLPLETIEQVEYIFGKLISKMNADLKSAESTKRIINPFI